MTALVLCDAFFAPVDRKSLVSLIEEYNATRARVENISTLIQGENRKAVAYFLRGNPSTSDRCPPNVDELFKLSGAIAALDAVYWQRALDLTDVFQCFPEARRKEWINAIHERRTPPFSEEAVFPTIEDLLLSRGKYFAERCDGLYRELSHSHKTNKPIGFSRRMIYNYVFHAGGYVNHSRAGTLHDLRCIIARFMGRAEPNWHVSSNDLTRCMRRPGQWHPLDGGALHIKVFYGTGTAHIRLHDDIVLRLNGVLASIYPSAIPASQRTPQGKTKQAKAADVLQRPLPFSVLNVLRSVNVKPNPDGGASVSLGYIEAEQRFAREQAVSVLEQIGAVADARDSFVFDYNPADVLDEVVMSGVVPDERSHQYFPTPREVAEQAIVAAQIGPQDRCLEPSAGQGHLADLMPAGRTTCVELSGLHCAVLRAKGHTVHKGDFIDWAARTTECFDKILMNPPFTAGQALAHLKVAAGVLASGGRLIAIMPSSARGKNLLEGWTHEWSEPIPGAFEGTSVEVVILTATNAGSPR